MVLDRADEARSIGVSLEVRYTNFRFQGVISQIENIFSSRFLRRGFTWIITQTYT